MCVCAYFFMKMRSFPLLVVPGLIVTIATVAIVLCDDKFDILSFGSIYQTTRIHFKCKRNFIWNVRKPDCVVSKWMSDWGWTYLMQAHFHSYIRMKFVHAFYNLVKANSTIIHSFMHSWSAIFNGKSILMWKILNSIYALVSWCLFTYTHSMSAKWREADVVCRRKSWE